MADIQYLNYGDQQIEQQALLNSLANNVQSYVAKQSWSNKRKQKFMSAYSDLMNKGILGASNTTGQWMIDVNDEIDLNSMDQKDREMYQEAAYFIQQQMAGLPTKASQEEKKEDKSELPLFDNKYFTTNFMSHIGHDRFGGRDWTTSEWNELDERDSNGLRGTNERAKALAGYLRSYSDSLEEGKYNFEGSPFNDLNDFKTRINTAITELENGTWNQADKDALNRIGLNPADWFNNGSGDPSGQYITLSDGTQKELSYAELAKHNQEQAKLKAEQDAEIAKQKQLTAYNNTLFFNRVTSPKMYGQNPTALKSKYKDSNSLLSALQGYAQKDIRTLTPDEQSEVQGAYRYLANQPIDNKLLKQLQSSSSGLYKNAAPNRFRKINGIDNLIWDSVAKQVIQINTRQQQEAIQNQPQDLFAGVQTLQDKQQAYMNSTEGGFTPAEQREVAALLFDLGAAVDPEGFSSAGISQVASTIRDYNRATDPEGWTWGDTGWSTLDHGLGLLSLIPVAGGWLKGTWALSKLGKYLPKMEQFIRYAGRAGSTYAMASNAPGALNTLNKIKNGEDLSLKDYQDLAYFFIGGLGHHQLNRGNRVERSAMKARGVETSNSVLNKAGITRTKPKVNTTETTPTLKVKKTGEDGKVETKEIPIDAEKQKILSKTKAEDLEAKAKELEIEIPEGYKIDSKSTSTKTWSRENLNRYRSKGNKEIFGTQTSQKEASALKSDEEFEQYLSKHNNTWLKKFINGSNRDIRRYDRYLGNNNQSSQESSKKSQKDQHITKREPPLTPEEAQQLKENVKSWRQEHSDILNINKDKGREYEWSKNDVGVNPDRLKSSVKLGDKELNVEIASDGILMINGERTSINGFGKSGKREVRKKIKELVQQTTKEQRLKRSTEEFNKLVQELRKLKASGFLKQGGTIDKQKIQKYKEFINK